MPDMTAELRRLPIFAALSSELLGELAALASARPVRRGQVLFAEGDEASYLPALLSGRLKLARIGPDGREQVLHMVRAPSSFAEAAVFGPGRFPATAEVTQDGTLLLLPRPALLDLLRRRPEVALALLASMSLWLRRLVDLVEGLSLHTVEERVAGYLWAALVRGTGRPEPGATVLLEDPKHVIAALCGTAPEVLSRTFRKLEGDGAIRVDGPRVTLLDPAAMRDRMP